MLQELYQEKEIFWTLMEQIYTDTNPVPCFFLFAIVQLLMIEQLHKKRKTHQCCGKTAYLRMSIRLYK